MARGPYTVVNPSPLAGPPTSLLEAATIIELEDEHWLAGITFRPENAAPLRGVDPCALTAGAATPYTGRAPVLSDPVILEQEEECSAFGWAAADYLGRARRGLAVKEPQAFEAEFWTPSITATNYGLADGLRAPTDVATTTGQPTISSASSNWQPFMVGWTATGGSIPANTTVLSVQDGTHLTLSANAGATATGVTVTFRDPALQILNGGTAVSPGLALAYLNEAIARAPLGMGWIHATAFLTERWFSARAVVGGQAGPTARLYSVNGNAVIPGNGYSGVGPDGTGGPADGQGAAPVQWAFATEPFQVFRTPEPTVYPDTLAQASQRELNLVTYRASRPYAHNWGRLLKAAVKVNVAATG